MKLPEGPPWEWPEPWYTRGLCFFGSLMFIIVVLVASFLANHT